MPNKIIVIETSYDKAQPKIKAAKYAIHVPESWDIEYAFDTAAEKVQRRTILPISDIRWSKAGENLGQCIQIYVAR